MLVGEPGSGKTYLLLHLVREGRGLFLTPSPWTQLDNEIREKKPLCVIVDDAHFDPGLLASLRQRRQDLRADFSILATTWPGEKDSVAEALALLPPQVRELELLARSEILEIYRNLKVSADDNVMRWLVTQAAHRPGLAVTLANLWLAGAFEEIFRGEAFSRSIITPLRRMVGPKAIDILAAFSLGGAAGMGLKAVGDALGMNPGELWQKAAALTAGGVLTARRDNAMAVIPEALRPSLLRQVFFAESPPILPFESLLEAAPSFDDAIREIVIATRGSSRSQIRDLVQRSSSPKVWSLFASRGREEARWVLENYPEDIVDVGGALLEEIPDLAIGPLLEWSALSSGSSTWREDRALNLLNRWVSDIGSHRQRPDEPIRRRQILAKKAGDFLYRGGSREVGLHAVRLALSPTLHGSSSDPGAGTTISLSFGLLQLEALRRISEIWEEARAAIGTLDRIAWKYLSSALWDWLHPTSAAKRADLPKEVFEAMREVAELILRDLLALSQGSPGATAGVVRLAEPVGIHMEAELDPIFELLYPSAHVKVGENPEQGEAIRQLANHWSLREPEAVAKDLAFYEAEASKIHFPRPGSGRHLGASLAAAVSEPEKWLRSLLEMDSGSDFVQPMMERVARERRPGWEDLLQRSFASRSYAWDATRTILEDAEPPSHLLDLAMENATKFPQLVETLCLRQEVPLLTLARLLDHPDCQVSLAAAIEEWGPAGRMEVRHEIEASWREAILRARSGDSDAEMANFGPRFWLGGLLNSDSTLAMEWLRRRFQEDLPTSVFPDGTFARAIDGLSQQQRLELIDELPKAPQGFLAHLIGRDLALYEHLLSRDSLRPHHLEPLAGAPDPAWLEMAIRALETGHDPEEVAYASFGGSHSYSGPGVDHWQMWDEGFAALESHPRADVRTMARAGRRKAGTRLDHAKARKRQFDLRGVN